MEVLNMKPVAGKKVVVFLVEKEGVEKSDSDYAVLSSIFDNYEIKFATIDTNGNDLTAFKHNHLAKFLNDHILAVPVDIPEYAKGYLYNEIFEKEEQITGLETEYMALDDKDSLKARNLKSWIDYLKDETERMKGEIEFSVKPQWIVKKILDIAKYYTDETLYIVHFTPRTLMPELRRLLDEMDVLVLSEGITEEIVNPLVINEE